MRCHDDDADGGPDGEQGDDDGQSGGDDRAEHQDQDDQCGQQARALRRAGPALSQQTGRVTAQFDPEPLALGLPGGVEDALRVVLRHVLRRNLQHHGGVADRAVRGYGAPAVVRTADLADPGQPGDVVEHVRHAPFDAGIAQAAVVVQDDLDGVPGTGGAVPGQQVGRPLRLGAGQGIVVAVVVAHDRRHGPDAGQDRHPQEQGGPCAAVGEARDTGEHPLPRRRSGLIVSMDSRQCHDLFPACRRVSTGRPRLPWPVDDTAPRGVTRVPPGGEPCHIGTGCAVTRAWE